MIPATMLLSALGAGVRLRGVASSAKNAGAASGTDADFARMLEQAKSGTLASHAPVSVAKGVDLKLSDTQLARLADAADRAEAQGAARAIVLIDGKALSLDVATRTITGTADANSNSVLSQADAVITVAPDAGEAPSIGPPGTGAATLANPTILKGLTTPQNAVTPAVLGVR